MKYKTLLRLGLQLFGLYILLLDILAVPRAWSMYALLRMSAGYNNGPVDAWTIFVAAVGLVVFALIGFALIYNAEKLVAFFVREDDAELVNVNKENVIEVSTILLGLYMVVEIVANGYNDVVQSIYTEQYSVLITKIITLFVGAILVWQARRISRFILKINAINKD